jgi:hypothetical protein
MKKRGFRFSSNISGSLPVLLICFAACQGYESSIPDAAVYLKRNIYTYNLNGSGSYLYIDSKAYKTADESIGYGGILIVHSYDETYYAFDLSCPVEHSKKVLIGKPDQGLFCECDSCGEKYYLGDGTGTPQNNITKKPLRSYTVHLDEKNNIIITR